MIEITLHQAEIRIGDLPNGNKSLQFATPQGIIVTVFLTPDGARIVASGLTTGLIIANAPLATPNGRPN